MQGKTPPKSGQSKAEVESENRPAGPSPAETAAATAISRPISSRGLRDRVSTGFTWIEDIVYIGLGLLLAGSAITLLVAGAVSFGRSLLAGTLPGQIIDQLDRILLILMIVEILYTVQVSFRQHVLVPEPFLIVGLIATTRRILILTAEFSSRLEKGEVAFRNAMLELGLLTLLIVALVASLRMLRQQPRENKDRGA